MESFKLGVLGLSEPEQSLVSTLFRLHRVDPSFIWTLSTVPPFDALLVDAGVSARSYVQDVGPRTNVKRLSPPGITTPGEMPRPIRSDLLVGWLTSIEAGLLQAAPQTATPLLSPVVASASGATPAKKTTRPVEVSPRLMATPAPPLPNDSMLFKLRRWPSAGVLARDVGRIRMATLLSRKLMSLPELTLLSRLPDGVCVSFLRELDTQGLLECTERHLQKAPVARTQGHKAETVQAVRPRPGVASSLIHSIRRRFGIG